MLFGVIVGLMLVAELAKRSRVVAVFAFALLPLALTIFWWPHSTKGTASAGWFPIVKAYSALAGSLMLTAGAAFKRVRHNKVWLASLPVILALNIAEAVVRDFQCFSLDGVDPSQGMWTLGGPWNLMNGIAGILNLVAICGWMGIIVSKRKGKAIVWPDQTWLWIIAYDLWNFAYVYNCLADRAWYSGVALLAACTIPAYFLGRGSWIQYRSYTLSLWCIVVLTFPHFMQDSLFAHRSSHNTTAMFVISLAALVVNVWLLWVHVQKIRAGGKNVLRQEIYSDTRYYAELMREHATEEDKLSTAARAGRTPAELDYAREEERDVSRELATVR